MSLPPGREIEMFLIVRPATNVVQIQGVVLDAPDGVPRIVMEWCAHGSLRAHLQALAHSHDDKVAVIRGVYTGVFCELKDVFVSTERGLGV